jgi:hypothetical protein
MDPATNLVTFNANASDTAAYNNYLMVESYLVVPTSGLTAQKAQKLAQYIRFITGPVAASDMEVLGAAPPTPTMVAADQKVATELDGESAEGANSTTPTTSSGTSTTSTTTTASTTSTTAATTAATAASVTTGDSGNSGSGLAFTGAGNPVPAVGVGAALVLMGTLGRRRLRRVRRRGVGS